MSNFFVCGPKFTNFISPNVEAIVVDRVIPPIFDVNTIQRYSRSKSKVVRNRAEIGRFLAFPKMAPTLLPLPHGTTPGKVL